MGKLVADIIVETLSGLMSGDGKRGVGHRLQATAPILDSTKVMNVAYVQIKRLRRATDAVF
jgi:hypothetical protein